MSLVKMTVIVEFSSVVRALLIAKTKALGGLRVKNGAQEGTRTPTTLRSPAPEAGASTNFATWARLYYKGRGAPEAFSDQFGFFPVG